MVIPSPNNMRFNRKDTKVQLPHLIPSPSPFSFILFFLQETILQKHHLCTSAISGEPSPSQSDRKPTCTCQQCLLVMWELLARQHTIGCTRTEVTRSFEHIFVRRRSKARRSLYFSACDSLRRLDESESITYEIDIGSGCKENYLRILKKNGNFIVGRSVLQTASNI